MHESLGAVQIAASHNRCCRMHLANWQQFSILFWYVFTLYEQGARIRSMSYWNLSSFFLLFWQKWQEYQTVSELTTMWFQTKKKINNFILVICDFYSDPFSTYWKTISAAIGLNKATLMKVIKMSFPLFKKIVQYFEKNNPLFFKLIFYS